MKFKYVFLIFNILIVFLLLVIIVMPVFFIGPGFMQKFWITGWPMLLVLCVIMLVINVFFLSNRRLFKLLEREDWPALVDYLEHRVVDKNRYSSRLVKLLANSYLIMSDSAGVLRLEKKLSAEKPVFIEKNALIFGAARILGGDSIGAADFFHTRIEKNSGKNSLWIRWYYGFSLLLSKAFVKAETEFKALAEVCDDAVITGLSAWFLSDALLKHSKNKKECESIAAQGRMKIVKMFKKSERWEKEAAKIETEIHGAIIKKYIDEAEKWLFMGSDNE